MAASTAADAAVAAVAAAATPSIVLVTGANGFLGAWCVKKLPTSTRPR